MKKNNILIGKYGNLTIIEYLGSINYSGYSRISYKCKCDCGNIIKVIGSHLKLNKKTQCNDCSFKERSLNKKQVTQLEQHYNHDIILRCKNSKNNIINKLTLKQYENIINKNCFYCNEPPTPSFKFKNRKYVNTEIFKFNGVDRIDSSKGYSESNCVACCTICNRMKLDLTIEDFKNKIKLIYKNLKLSRT